MADSAYTPAQIAEYLEYIGLPPTFHPAANPTLDLAYLTALFTHQITAVPYENLCIHYSPQHAVDLDPQALFTKIVSRRAGRGGYCMENSIFFSHVLRALGFADAYTAGVRIRQRVDGIPQGDYTGYVHLVIILTLPADDSSLPKQKYVVDVGFGGDGMTLPMPLVENLVHHNSLGTQEIRLARDYAPFQRYRGPEAPRMWIYQYRNGKDREWNSFYAFAEFEFTEADFRIISFYTSQSPDSHHTYSPLVIRFLRGPGDGGPEKARVAGKITMLKGAVKRNLTGKTEVVRECQTEEERVEVLRDMFNIHLSEEEVASIRGGKGELTG